MQNLAGANSILKEFYIAPIIEQLNQEVMLLQMFEEESVDWQGKVAIVPVHTSRNSGWGFRGEGQGLPVAGHQGYGRYEIPAKFGYGSFGFTGPSLEFSDTEKGSFEPVMTGEMKRLVEDVRVGLDKACFTGGQVIGLVWQSQAAGTVWQYSGRPDVTVDPDWGVAVGPGHTVTFIRLDQSAGLGYSAVGVATQVNSITESTLTINAGIQTNNLVDAAGNAIHPVFAVVHNDAQRLVELSGVFDNLANPNNFGLNRDQSVTVDYAKLMSNFLVADFTAAAPTYFDLSLDALQILLDKILLTSNAQPDGMIINPVHRQSYATLMQGTLSGVPSALRVDAKSGAAKADGGFTALGYADIPFRTAQHAPKGTIAMLARKFWGVFQRRPGDFADIDGHVLKWVPGFDAYQGFWRQYLNVVCKRPNAQGILTGVNYYGV